MKVVKLEEYFIDEVAFKIRDIFKIRSMNQLLSLASRREQVTGLPEAIGIDKDLFWEIINTARDSVDVPERSSRKYPYGNRFGRSS